MTERIAVYGGSFDPPHAGHLLAATWIVTCTSVDRLLVVPTFAHALGKAPCASFEDRVAMCEALVRELPRCAVSDLERTLPTPSRTFHTLDALRALFPEAELRLVVGADIARETGRWHRWDDVVAMAKPLWLGREGYPRPEGASLDFPKMSSTDLRARLARGEPVDGCVPNAVLEVMRARRLYGRQGA